MLTLLLAPEAYVAIGLAFALLLLAAVGLTLAARLNRVPASPSPAAGSV
jgi:hypothetical protein